MNNLSFDMMRKAMVDSQLRPSDVNDPRIIRMMSHVARENFVPVSHRDVAYADRGIKLGEGRFLNAPLATGLLLNVAALKPQDTVLLIGAATGYAAALISPLVQSVTAVEQSATLADEAKKNLAAFDNIHVENSNHANGAPAGAPYSVIVIDGTIETTPDQLTGQLADDGRIVASIMDRGVARLAIGEKAGGMIGYQYFADCGSTPLPGFEKAKAFQF